MEEHDKEWERITSHEYEMVILHNQEKARLVTHTATVFVVAFTICLIVFSVIT